MSDYTLRGLLQSPAVEHQQEPGSALLGHPVLAPYIDIEPAPLSGGEPELAGQHGLGGSDDLGIGHDVGLGVHGDVHVCENSERRARIPPHYAEDMKIRATVDAPNYTAARFENTGDFVPAAEEFARLIRKTLPIPDGTEFEVLEVGDALRPAVDIGNFHVHEEAPVAGTVLTVTGVVPFESTIIFAVVINGALGGTYTEITEECLITDADEVTVDTDYTDDYIMILWADVAIDAPA